MVARSSQLLALIHQHLLHNGYCKTARELQIESGEKFISQKGSLKRIFRHWNTKDQKGKSSKQRNPPSKKPRLEDPVSPSESSDEKDNAHPKGFGDLVVQGKKASVKKAGKLKTQSSTPKKMNSAKKSASKGKGAPKTGAPSRSLKPVAPENPGTLAESSEDSDSEDEDKTVPSKAALTLETPLKSTPAEVLKSKTSLTTDSQAARNDKSLTAKTTTASSNGKAMAKDDSSDSSESSDETDIEKPPVTVAPKIATPSVSRLKTPSTGTQPKADSSETSESESEEEPGSQVPTPATFQVKATTPSAKTSAAQVKATKGNSITKAPPVAASSQSSSAVGKPTAKTTVDDSSEDSDSDEEVPIPATFQVKATTTSAKTSAAQVKATKGNSITKAPPVAAASQSSSAVGKPTAKTTVDDSSEDSDSDEELVPSTPMPTAPSSGQTSNQKLRMHPTVPNPSSDDSSTSSEAESEEEPVRQKMPLPEVAASQDKVDPPVTMSQSKPARSDCNDPSADTVVAVVSENSASLGKTQNPAKAEVSETSDSSDSEKEPEKTTASPRKGVTPAASKPSAAVPAGAEGSESSDSSDSESEAPKKSANNLPELNVRTPVPSTKQPVAASRSAKARTPLPVPADDTSETEDTDSEEEPVAKKTASQLSASSLKTPSTSAKRPVTPSHTANAGKLQKTTIADDSSDTEDSDSEEDKGAKKTGSHLKASSVKTPSTGAKQPVTLAAHTTGVKVASAPLPVDDSSETEDSDSDESLAKAPTPAIATPKQKPITKSTAVTPVSQASVSAVRTPAKMAADESSEDSDSDEEPSSSVKAPVPSIVTPSVKPSVAIAARVPDSDADSESSDSEERTPAVGTTKPSKPALAAKGKLAISATSQPDEESSSEDSDSDTDERVQSAIQTQKTKVALHNKTASTPSAGPLSATKEKTPASRKAIVAQNPSTDTSETIDSSDYDNPLVGQTLKGSFLSSKGAAKLSLQPGTAVKSKKGSPIKAVTNTESWGNNKEEQDTLNTDAPALAKHKMSTTIPLSTSTPSVASPAKGKAGLSVKSQKAVKTAQVLVKESSESESDEKVGTPAPTSAKAVVEKRKHSIAKTPKASQEKTVKSASRGKTSVALTAKVSSESSETNCSDEDATKVTKQTPTEQTKLEMFFKKESITPVKTKDKTAARLPKALLPDSDETSDDEEEPVKEATPAPASPKTSHGKQKKRLDLSSFSTPKTKHKSLISSPKALDTHGKVSGDVPSKPTASGEEDDSSDNSEPEESQSQAKTPTKPLPTKRKRDKEDKTALANETITQSSKRKPKVKAQPSTKSTLSAPATPGALLDSEEETVMALLEGRSPKKSKKNPSKKTVAATQVVAPSTHTVQYSYVLERSLPPSVRSALVPEIPSSVHKGDKTLDAKSPGVLELGHLSAKKQHGKKRKGSPEDGDSKQKDKKAKKAKKEKKDKKVKETSLTGEAASPKPSKKKKSEKSEKKKDKKQTKKESKKLLQSLIAPVGESTDSGVSLQSKPKKKKKVKSDETTD